MIDSHCPVSGILLFYSIRWALSYARVVQGARIRKICELSVTKLEASHAHVVQAYAVNHLHNLRIVHRDIKLENVMVKNDGHVVLGDFDLESRMI